MLKKDKKEIEANEKLASLRANEMSVAIENNSILPPHPILGHTARSFTLLSSLPVRLVPCKGRGERKVAFTLAEVLITLGIIGIVAAMTMPALITKHQQVVAVNKLKKSYSVLQNAVSAMIAANDTIPPAKMSFVYQLWDHPTYFNPDMFSEEFDKYLMHTESVAVDPLASQTLKMCANGNENHKGYTFINGNNYNWNNIRHYWVLKDGTCVGLKTTSNWNWLESDNQNDWVVFYVDIDGSYRGYNRFGRDTFAFTFNPDGKIVPFGINIDSNNYFSCRRGAAGLYCTAKLVKDGWQIKKDYPW